MKQFPDTLLDFSAPQSSLCLLWSWRLLKVVVVVVVVPSASIWDHLLKCSEANGFIPHTCHFVNKCLIISEGFWITISFGICRIVHLYSTSTCKFYGLIMLIDVDHPIRRFTPFISGIFAYIHQLYGKDYDKALFYTSLAIDKSHKRSNLTALTLWLLHSVMSMYRNGLKRSHNSLMQLSTVIQIVHLLGSFFSHGLILFAVSICGNRSSGVWMMDYKCQMSVMM